MMKIRCPSYGLHSLKSCPKPFQKGFIFGLVLIFLEDLCQVYKLVRDRGDLDDEFLGLVSPGLMLLEKKAAVCSSKPGRLLPMVKSLSV